MSSDRVPFEMSQTESDEQFERLFGGTDPRPVNEASYEKLTLFADDVMHALGIHGEI